MYVCSPTCTPFTIYLLALDPTHTRQHRCSLSLPLEFSWEITDVAICFEQNSQLRLDRYSHDIAEYLLGAMYVFLEHNYFPRHGTQHNWLETTLDLG